jgi:hypothetical protein
VSDPLHELGNLRSEVLLEVFPGCPGILQGIVKKPCDDCREVCSKIRKDPCNPEGMVEVGFARDPLLPLVDPGGVHIGFIEEILIEGGEIFGKGIEDLPDPDDPWR